MVQSRWREPVNIVDHMQFMQTGSFFLLEFFIYKSITISPLRKFFVSSRNCIDKFAVWNLFSGCSFPSKWELCFYYYTLYLTSSRSKNSLGEQYIWLVQWYLYERFRTSVIHFKKKTLRIWKLANVRGKFYKGVEYLLSDCLLKPIKAVISNGSYINKEWQSLRIIIQWKSTSRSYSIIDASLVSKIWSVRIQGMDISMGNWILLPMVSSKKNSLNHSWDRSQHCCRVSFRINKEELHFL